MRPGLQAFRTIKVAARVAIPTSICSRDQAGRLSLCYPTVVSTTQASRTNTPECGDIQFIILTLEKVATRSRGGSLGGSPSFSFQSFMIKYPTLILY